MGEKSGLGEMLRCARRERRMTGNEVAASVGVSQATISKIESGQLVPDLDYLAKFVHTLRLPRDEAKRLMQLAGLVPGGVTPDSVLQYLPVDFLQVDWSRRRQETIALAESRSKSIRVFNPLLIPGLLQTEDYARHVIATAGVREGQDVENAVKARLRRQRILGSEEKAFTFITSEAALLTRVGPAEVMATQIRQLKHLASTRPIRLGVLGFEAAVTVLPPPGFYLLDRRVYMELPHGDLWLLERSHAFGTYHRLFARLVQQAVLGAAFITKLDELVDRIQSSTPPTP